ncbi:MAG: acetate/propionate family kinase [Candidatus Poribacteria bacterium]
MKVLVINAGSSSVKYKLYLIEDEKLLAEGIIDRIGLSGSNLVHKPIDKSEVEIQSYIPNYETALSMMMAYLTDADYGVIKSTDEISAIGHRVVHGGEKISSSVLITEEIENIIKECFDLAPLHNPPNLMGIQACKKLLPNINQVAVFDTAFHRTIPKYAYLYAIPYRLYEEYSIRRYGFHGTSHRFVAHSASEFLGQPLEKLKMITCHLGNGCSITAIKDGKSIDTSMGFTPLEGLIMGTRSGDIDPAIIFYFIERIGLSVQEVNSMLNRESGLLGLSGISRDMRDILKSAEEGNEKATTAINCFVYRIKKYIGAYSASMGGLDVLVFTAGIGENSSLIRSLTCKGLEYLGLYIDEEKNSNSQRKKAINADDSKVKVLVIPTDEELMIARDTAKICGLNTT